MLAKRFLTFLQPNIQAYFLYQTLKLKKRYYIIDTEAYTVDFYYFMGSGWCLLAYKVLEFTELHPSVFKLKPYVKKSFGSKRSLQTCYTRYLR